MEVMIYMTEKCNMVCKYCYEGLNKTDNMLNEETLFRTIEYVSSIASSSEIHFTFLGGEPLLNKEILIKAVELIEEKFLNYKITYSITTNATLLDHKIVDFLYRHHFQVSISIDGDEHTHNINRIAKDGKNIYSVVMANLTYLIKTNKPFSVRMTIDTNNVGFLSKNISYFLELGVKSIFMSINYLGNWREKELKVLNEQLHICDRLYIERVSKTNDKIINFYDFKIGVFIAERKTQYCSAGSKNHFVVKSDGTIYPCSYVTYNEEWNIGNVIVGTNMSKLCSVIKQHVEKEAKCKECNIAFTCVGARCGFLNYALNQKMNYPSFKICEIEKIVYEHNLHVIRELLIQKNKRVWDVYEYCINNNINISSVFRNMLLEEKIIRI